MRDTTTSVIRSVPLWLGMVGAPVMWFIHFYTVWLVVEVGCELGLGENRWLGVNAVHLLVLVISLLALAVTGAAGFTSYRNFRQLRALSTDERDSYARAVGRAYFMALAGMGFAAMFLLVILYVTLPVFVLPPCDL